MRLPLKNGKKCICACEYQKLVVSLQPNLDNMRFLTFILAFVVVLDAGHGGKDPGAVGKVSQEKDLNLAVALKAGEKIKKAYPEVKVLFTRTTDVFLPLQSRADFVNKNDADLFICIHTNSADNASAEGAETFVLGTEKMDKNLDVAMRENSVIKLESDYQTTYQGFDPNSIDSYIMFELMQNKYMTQSLRFAELMQQQFVSANHRLDRGVRQAAFWVLLKSACPSVLIEMGFISNRNEEKYLASKAGQDSIAASICNAFAGIYKSQLPSVEKPVEMQQSQSKAKAEQKPLYAVQILASKNALPSDDALFQGEKCEYVKKGDWYKYYTAKTADKKQASEACKRLRSKFKDCFVITL